MPVPTAMVAFMAEERFTKKCSSASLVLSPFTVTKIVLTVSPGLNVSVLEAATASHQAGGARVDLPGSSRPALTQ